MWRSKVLMAFALGLLIGGTAFGQFTDEPDATAVFLSDPVNGDILQVHFDDGVYLEEIVTDFAGVWGDLVFGPDELLYACAPEYFAPEDKGAGDSFDGPGLIVRFDPDNPQFIELVHDGFDGPPYNPECGWFSSRGDLVVTDKAPGSGVYYFEGIASIPIPPPPANKNSTPYTPTLLAGPSLLGDNFVGSGITQAANGDLLFVDQPARDVWNMPYDPVVGFLPIESTPVITATAVISVTGIARLSTGEIFVTGGTELIGYRLEAQPGEGKSNGKVWTEFCSADFPDGPYQGCVGYPQFVEPTANDWLYVATEDVCDLGVKQGDALDPDAGSLWAVSPDCEIWPTVEPSPIITTTVGAFVGVGLTPTRRTVVITDTIPVDDQLVFDFGDHIHEVTARCTEPVTMTAVVTPPSCLDRLIPDENNDDEPDAELVTYLGEGGLGNVYHVPQNSCVPVDDVFLHAISAYTDLLDNPTIVRCVGEVDDYQEICNNTYPCEFLDLASFFPFDGSLPEDGRIGSRGTTSFSLYFLVDKGLGGDGAGTGSWCGFRSPVRNAYTPDDPMSTFREGRTIPFKFKMAEGVDGDCRRGPFIAPEGILLSIARVDPDFESKEIVCVGGGCGEVPYFDPPNKAKKGFHMNVRTDGFEPGIYQAVLVATGGEFPVAWTYFRIQ